MGRKPDPSILVPPEVACWGNAVSIAWQRSFVNGRTFNSWFQLFMTLATTSFDWEGLPPSIDARWLERALFFGGSAAVSKVAGVPLAMRYSNEGPLDLYDNPNRIRMKPPRGQGVVRHANAWIDAKGKSHKADCAIGWDNLLRLPLYDSIVLACSRLAAIDVTIDQNIIANRAPFIFKVSETGKVNAVRMFDSINAGEPAIYESPTADVVVDGEVWQSGVTFLGNDLLNAEERLKSQCMTLIGIDNNPSSEKREQIQSSEVTANNEQFLVMRASRQKARERFGREIGALLGIPAPRPRFVVRHEPGEVFGNADVR